MLRLGRHTGPNRGYGAAHIWAEHQAEIAAQGLFDATHVATYVASIVRIGTPLFFDGAQQRNHRLVAVRSSTGMAVLEGINQRDGFIWSVVTAYSKTTTHGTRVGTVR